MQPNENNGLLESAKCPQTDIESKMKPGAKLQNIQASQNWIFYLKVVVLLAVWVISVIFLVTVKEKIIHYQLFAIENNKSNGAIYM